MARGDYDSVISALSHSGMDDDLVKELVDIISQFEGVAHRLKAFPKGQFNPDGVYLHTVLDPEGLQGIVKILLEVPRIDSIEIFPRGIINPEIFSARIGLR
jgi:hypothetical protein